MKLPNFNPWDVVLDITMPSIAAARQVKAAGFPGRDRFPDRSWRA